jgi:hypothetical protein
MRHNRFAVGQIRLPGETAERNWLANWIAFVFVGAVSLLILVLVERLAKADATLVNSGRWASGNVATASQELPIGRSPESY